jgi:hypothetical protein
MPFSDREKEELRAFVVSESMHTDADLLIATRHNPFIIDRVVDCDRVVEFLTDYNEFLGHPRKPRRPFIEKEMNL